MTLQLLHSEFPYIYEENLIFFFISVEANAKVNSQEVILSLKKTVRMGLCEKLTNQRWKGGEERMLYFFILCRSLSQSAYRGRVEKGGVYQPSQLERTLQLCT
jgi:hypothetical protein